MAWEIEIKQERRLCKVDGEYGYFHTWEQYSKPVGVTSADVFNNMFGIVEFEDGVRRVDPTEIKFYDDENEVLSIYNKRGE